MKNRKLLTIFFLLSAFTICGCANALEPKNDFVSVTLLEGNHYHVLNNNTQKIKRGEDAIWKVSVDENYVFASSSDGTYEDEGNVGKFIVKNIQMPKTVSFDTKGIGDYTLEIVNDSALGSVKVIPDNFSFKKGESITISVTPYYGQEFMCFTKTYPFRASNSYLPSGKPVSFKSTYTFNIEDDTTLYVNYFTPGLLRINYDANGGKTIDEESSLTLDYTIPAQFTKPSTLLGTHYLKRNGYTLTTFNTKPDGSGTSIGIGSSVDTSFAIDNEIKLYAQWSMWNSKSDFEYTMKDDGCHITKYIGNVDCECLVIPDKIDDETVTSIEKKAIENVNSRVIVLNENLLQLDEEAVSNCERLTDIYVFTNLSNVKSSSIASNSLEKLHINSTLYAYNSTQRDRDISGQIQLLEKMEKNRVVFFGPSTTRYNHPLESLIEMWPEKNFFLAGCIHGANQRLAFDLIVSILNNTDYILPTMYEGVVAPNSGSQVTFVFLEFNFDLLLKINYQYYKDYILDQFCQYVIDFKKNQGEQIFTNQVFSGYNNYGMYKFGSDQVEEGNVDLSYKLTLKNYLDKKNFIYYEEIIDKFLFPKDHVRIIWSTYNKNSVKDDDIIQFDQYEEFVLNTIPFEELEPLKDNIMDGILFRKNDSMHLSLEGGEIRVNRWKNIFQKIRIFD